MAIGDRIRIISEQEFQAMSPPRKPRGEKPATTIRLLRRQLASAQHTIKALQLDRGDKEKVIAGYDVQLSEAQDAAHNESRRSESQARRIADLTLQLRMNGQRLAYLEGYYAKSKENAPAVYTTRPLVPGDTAETDAGPGSRDQADLSAGGQRSRGAGIEPGPSGFGAGLGEQVRREPVRDTAHQEGRKVEHITISAHDDPTKWGV